MPIIQERQIGSAAAVGAQAGHSTLAMLRPAAKMAAKIGVCAMLGVALLAAGSVNQDLDQIRGQEYAYVVKPFPTVTPGDLVVYVSYTPSELAFGSYDSNGLYLRCLPVAANTAVLSYDSQQPSGTKPLHVIWAFQDNVNEITSVTDAQRMEAAIQKALPGMRLALPSPETLAEGGVRYAEEMAKAQQLRLRRR
jgi:hypothetical protein